MSDTTVDYNEDGIFASVTADGGIFAAVMAFINRGRIINDDNSTIWSVISRYEHIGLNKYSIQFCPRTTTQQVPFELLFLIMGQFVHFHLSQYSIDFVEVDLVTYFVGVNQLRSDYFTLDDVKNIETTDDIIQIQLLKNAIVKDYKNGLTFDFVVKNHIIVVAVLYQNTIHIPKITVTVEIIQNENVLNSIENCLTLLKIDRATCYPVDDEYFEPNYVPHEFDDYDNDPSFTIAQPDWIE